jgi:AraC-like DNA-binding protein
MKQPLRLELISLTDGESFAWREFIEPRFSSPWHFHPEVELTLIRRGSGQLFVGDAIVRFNEGDIFPLGGGLPHVFYSDEPPKTRGKRALSHAVVIQFLPDVFGAKFWEIPEHHDLRELWKLSRRGILFATDARPGMRALLGKIGSQRGVSRTLGLLELFNRCAGALEHSRLLCSEGYVFRPDIYSERRINAVCRYVFENSRGHITLAEAARRAAMNPSAFCRYFGKVTGKRFTTFVNEVRVGQVCRALIETRQGIAEIAFANGFESLSNFNRWFGAVHRMNPKCFRSIHHQFKNDGAKKLVGTCISDVLTGNNIPVNLPGKRGENHLVKHETHWQKSGKSLTSAR